MIIEVFSVWNRPTYSEYMGKLVELRDEWVEWKESYSFYTQDIDTARLQTCAREEKVTEILKGIIHLFPQLELCPCVVFLTGSHARGITNWNSDIDLNLKTTPEFAHLLQPVWYQMKYAVSFIFQLPVEAVHSIGQNFVETPQYRNLKLSYSICWDSGESITFESHGIKTPSLLKDHYFGLDWTVFSNCVLSQGVEFPFREWLYSIRVLHSSGNSLSVKALFQTLSKQVTSFHSDEQVVSIFEERINFIKSSLFRKVADDTIGEYREAVKDVLSSVFICLYLVIGISHLDEEKTLFQQLSVLEESGRLLGITDELVLFEQNIGEVARTFQNHNETFSHANQDSVSCLPGETQEYLELLNETLLRRSIRIAEIIENEGVKNE